jgi:hypothetical protein
MCLYCFSERFREFCAVRKKIGTLNSVAIVAYLIGNALTYNHLVKTNPSVALETSTMLENLAIACVWPIYWLAELV